jgi:hypothetical protein
MGTLTQDNRWLTNVNPIQYKIWDTIFHDMTITWSFAKAILKMIEWDSYFVWKDTKKVDFDSERKVYDMEWNYLVIEYLFKWIRDKDARLLNENFVKEWHFSKELDNKRQTPKLESYFDHKWKYYIVINWLNKLTQEIDNNIWVYKWIIVNPGLYFQCKDNITKTIDDVNRLITYTPLPH